ncbi:MAG: type II toxin-antitoxin system prevent-host-death family antitoxin [Thermodesulfobacteriota bacterium]
MKKAAAVAELKANLSRYLSRVKAGEEVVVTERGIPVARLVPIERAAEGLQDLRDLERDGLIRLGGGSLPRSFWKLPRPRDAKGATRAAVARERDEGW